MHPVLLKFGGFTVYSYGFCVAVAVTLALWMSARLAQKNGLSSGTAVDLIFIVFIAGIAGARAFYVLQHLEEFSSRWLSAFWMQEGGLVWYGGFILAALSGWIYCRRRRLSVLAWADFFVPVLALAHGIGRIGCFLNGCCYGKNGLPAQLYESGGLFLLSAILFAFASKKPRAGELTAWYLVLYGALRFGVEFLRGDQSSYFYLTIPQWISFGVLLAGAALFKALYAGNHENKH